jgi:3-oxoacyl-[acyl-carrier-protein] synthase II
MRDERVVVVTGLGCVTPIGVTRESFWAAALSGTNGVRRLQFPELPADRELYGGQILPAAIDDAVFDRDQQFLFSNPARFAVTAAREAMADAGFQLTTDSSRERAARRVGPRRSVVDVDRWRFGVCLGSGTGNPRQAGGFASSWRRGGLDNVSPRLLWRGLPTAITAAVATEFGLCGPSHLFTTSCMAGNNAIGYAADLIRAGRADFMLAGGSEAMSWVVSNGFRMLTTTRGAALDRSQPFCAERRGVVVGEGAGMLVLERLAHARARGRRPYAEVLGSGFACDAYHLSSPHPDGTGGIAAVRQSLDRAGLMPEAVDYVSAHGTGSQLNDAVETRIIKAVLGDHAYRTPVSSIKSMIGHSLGAASAIEAIACALAIRDGRIPPTINYETPDPLCDLDWVPNVARDHHVDVALSTAFAFGGACSSLVLGRVA